MALYSFRRQRQAIHHRFCDDFNWTLVSFHCKLASGRQCHRVSFFHMISHTNVHVLVYSAGSNPNDDVSSTKWPTEYRVEYFQPPYMSMTRPSYTGPPEKIFYGQQFTLQVANPGNAKKFTGRPWFFSSSRQEHDVTFSPLLLPQLLSLTWVTTLMLSAWTVNTLFW